jgi:peptidylprolyl isomerase
VSGAAPTSKPAASSRYSRDGITVTGAPGEEPTITLAQDVGPADELVVADIVEGSGEPVAEGSVLTVNYVGVGQKSRKVFDSSWGAAPATFDLGGVIQGWQQGMVGMKPGGRRLLVIPGSLGYGSAGAGDVIGPDETLVFVVDLLQVTQP